MGHPTDVFTDWGQLAFETSIIKFSGGTSNFEHFPINRVAVVLVVRHLVTDVL